MMKAKHGRNPAGFRARHQLLDNIVECDDITFSLNSGQLNAHGERRLKR